MPGHNKQEMCTTLWQAKQKKRLTDRRKDGWRRGTLTQLDTARLSACSAPVWAPVLVLPLSLCPGIIARTACLFVCPFFLSVRLSATYAEALQPAQLLQDSHCVPDIIATIAFVLRSSFRLDNFFVPLFLHVSLSLFQPEAACAFVAALSQHCG